MDLKQVLEDAGLSDGESRVYLSLLKLGSVPVSVIKEETRLHRTTIYDFIEKLLNKGLVAYVIKNNIKYFCAAQPHKILDYVNEREENLRKAIPELQKISEFKKEEILVEVYPGKEGFKTLINDVLRHGKDYQTMGIDESIYKEQFDTVIKRYLKEAQRKGMQERSITRDDAKYVYSSPAIKYRYIPKEYFNPTSTHIWGDNVGILIWNPLMVIRIHNKEVADSYKKHFELLWKLAKKKP